MDELRKCPFCGEEVAIVEASGTAWAGREGDYIVCDKRCERVWMEASEKTIALWNTRPIEDALKKRLDEQETRPEYSYEDTHKYTDLRACLKKAVGEIVAYRNSAREKEQFGNWGGLDEALEVLDNYGLVEEDK